MPVNLLLMMIKIWGTRTIKQSPNKCSNDHQKKLIGDHRHDHRIIMMIMAKFIYPGILYPFYYPIIIIIIIIQHLCRLKSIVNYLSTKSFLTREIIIVIDNEILKIKPIHFIKFFQLAQKYSK